MITELWNYVLYKSLKCKHNASEKYTQQQKMSSKSMPLVHQNSCSNTVDSRILVIRQLLRLSGTGELRTLSNASVR